MPLRRAKKVEVKPEENLSSGEKILDVKASMQGSLIFKDPVNLRINGKFEGNLDTKGNLTIGENARVKASIKGENITIAGTVDGNIEASSSLQLNSQAKLTGDIKTPILSVAKGAVLNGKCIMTEELKVKETVEVSEDLKKFLTIEEVARYLEVDIPSIIKWAEEGKIPAVKDKNNWKFDKEKIDLWVASNKVK